MLAHFSFELEIVVSRSEKVKHGSSHHMCYKAFGMKGLVVY